MDQVVAAPVPVLERRTEDFGYNRAVLTNRMRNNLNAYRRQTLFLSSVRKSTVQVPTM